MMIAAAMFATALMVGVVPAHADQGADEQAFVDYLRSHGIPIMFDGYAVGEGYKVCAQLRNGMSPDSAKDQYGLFSAAMGPATVDAAQQFLCPDTL